MTAANTQPRIGYSLAFTSSLVAAITPTLPVARLNVAPDIGFASRHAFTSATTRSMVLGLVIPQEQHDRDHVAVGVQEAGAGLDVTRGLRELVGLARDVAPLEAALVPAGDGDLGDDRQRHDFLNASTLRIFHAKVSTAVMSSWLVHAGSFVSTITVRMSTPIENLLVMMLLSRL